MRTGYRPAHFQVAPCRLVHPFSGVQYPDLVVFILPHSWPTKLLLVVCSQRTSFFNVVPESTMLVSHDLGGFLAGESNVETSECTKGTVLKPTGGGGHTPPHSKVFHECPHVQNQRSSLRGDQPQSGHRMRGPDGRRLFSWSTSRSKTTDDLAEPSNSARA